MDLATQQWLKEREDNWKKVAAKDEEAKQKKQ